MEQELQRIKAEALDAIKDAADQQALQDIRVKYLGKKGEVTALLKGLGKLSPEERPKAGALVNAVREALEVEIDTVKVRMETAELNARFLHVICKIPSILQKTSYCARIHLQYKLVQCNVMNLIAQSV